MMSKDVERVKEILEALLAHCSGSYEGNLDKYAKAICQLNPDHTFEEVNDAKSSE